MRRMRWMLTVTGVLLVAACDPAPINVLGFAAEGYGWDSQEHPVADSIRFHVRTRNFASEPVEFPSRHGAFDFVVRDSTGALVWQRVVAAVGLSDPFTVSPGQVDLWEVTWHLHDLEGARVPAGTYSMVAFVGPDLSAPLVETDPIPFEVAPAPASSSPAR